MDSMWPRVRSIGLHNRIAEISKDWYERREETVKLNISFPGVIIPIFDNDHSILSIDSLHVRSNRKVFKQAEL